MMTTQPSEAGFSARFTTDELATFARQPCRLSSGRSMTALELLTAWSLHVHRIDRERSESGEDPRSWDANDFVAALLLRDFLEDCMVRLPTPVRSKVAELADGVDELFTSIAQVDDRPLIDQVAVSEQAGRRWWWQRIPDSGPVLTHLLE
jgi:hypothetical protein